MKKQIETIDCIIELLPNLVVHKPSPQLKKAYKKLQGSIRNLELEGIFNQPMSKEEKENRALISEVVDKLRKSGKKIVI